MLRLVTLLCLSVVTALSQSACVSIDSRIAVERIDRVATRRLNGAFSNVAAYSSVSTGPFGPPALSGNLTDLLGVSAAGADRVAISFDPDVGLTFVCYAGDKEVGKRYNLVRDSLTLGQDGAIELATEHESLEFPNAKGRATKSTRLFVNSEGDLAVVRVETEIDGGMMVIVPMVIVGHFKQLAIFRHVN